MDYGHDHAHSALVFIYGVYLIESVPASAKTLTVAFSRMLFVDRVLLM